MDENEQKQQLSIAYLHAVASAAGFVCLAPRVDNDSVDQMIVASGWIHKKAVWRSPKIDVQLKSIAREPLTAVDRSFTFRLKKNYDDLRHPVMVPRLLVVLLLPRQRNLRVLTRYAAYYASLLGMPEATQRGKVPVTLLRKNLLTVDNLCRLMVRASRRIRKLV